MSTQSGIQISPSLANKWSEILTDSETRVVKIVIAHEKLEIAETAPGTSSFESDFGLLSQLAGSAEEPSYLLFREELNPTSKWIFYALVPDSSPVRSKMLYASTRATLIRSLSDSYFSQSIFAASLSELTFGSYQAHLKHQNSTAPLTAREQELADLKEAEAKEAVPSDKYVPTHFLGKGADSTIQKWTREASEKFVQLFSEPVEGAIIGLGVDPETQEIGLSNPELKSLADIPPSEPSFAFYAAAPDQIVFIYSCPLSSPVRNRMIYSSSALGVARQAIALGVNISKKIETDTPEEVTKEYVLQEIGEPTASAASSEKVTPNATGQKFSKPSRPGRR